MDFQTIFSTLGLLGVGGAMGSYIQHLLNQKRETELRIQNLNENKYRSTLILSEYPAACCGWDKLTKQF